MRTVDEVVAEVMAVHAGKISTHSDRCYQYHAGCLAFLIRDLLAAEWDGVTVRGLPQPSLGGIPDLTEAEAAAYWDALHPEQARSNAGRES